jgi:predicted dienelactone hydrolase
MKKWLVLVFLVAFSFSSVALAQGPDDFVFGDPLPDAPALAVRGEYGVGVQTAELVNPDQIDVLSISDDTPNPTYDRPLTVDVWYPAVIPDDAMPLVEYEDVLGRSDNPDRPLIPFSFTGRALRDAAPDASGGPYPLVIVSHGYPGSRYMLTYLTENLASKGYVVAAIGHTESTYRDTAPPTSALYHRPSDILFVLDQVAAGSVIDGELVDASNTALVGYSFGGYGALVAGGAGLSTFAANMLASRSGSDAIKAWEAGTFEADPRIKAMVLFAPWGMSVGLWDEAGLAGLELPLLFVVGSEDDVSGYEAGVVPIFEGAVNADRYLLTYLGARHNVAPNPPPEEAYAAGLHLDEWLRYDDSVWDERRMNNINQHFITAFLGLHLKGDASYAEYLDVIPDPTEGVYALDDAGNPTDEHTYWPGFLPRTAVGLMLEHHAPGE